MEEKRVMEIPINNIVPNPYQPRRVFSQSALEELSESIKVYGILQPITVRSKNNDEYELVAGERRLRASKLAGLETIPVIINNMSDESSAVLALLENLQREDLNFIEEAMGYENLIKEHCFTQQQLAEKLGKNQSTIANKIRILRLPTDIKIKLVENSLTERHARALLKLQDEELMREVLDKIIKSDLNVKKTEKLIADILENLKDPKGCEDKKQTVKGIMGMRIYLNTIKQAYDAITNTGLEAKYKEIDKGDHIEVVVKIPKDKRLLLSSNLFLKGKGVRRMGKVIAVFNQKGGVGKTTTNVNLSASIAKMGKKVLVLDLDPQGNSTSGYGIEKSEVENTIYEVLINNDNIEDAIIKTEFENIDIVASATELAGAEIEFTSIENREYILKKAIDKIRDNYDYIFIDCPPSLGMLTINCLTAVDSVLIPIQCEYYALEGVSQLMETISLIKRSLNPNLEIQGVVLSMFDGRANLSIQVVEEVKKYFKGSVYTTLIPRNVRLAEAPSHGKPAIYYDARCKGSIAYLELAEEFIDLEEDVI